MPLKIVDGKLVNVTWDEWYGGQPPPPPIDQGTLGTPITPSGKPKPGPRPSPIQYGPGPAVPAIAPPQAPTYDPRLLQAGRGTNRAPEPPVDPSRFAGALALLAQSPGSGAVFDRLQNVANNPPQTPGSRANRADFLASRSPGFNLLGAGGQGSQFQATALGLKYGSLPQFNPVPPAINALGAVPGGFFRGVGEEWRSDPRPWTEKGFMGLFEAGGAGAGEAYGNVLRESTGMRGSNIVAGREEGAPPAFGSEQARLGPVAQAEAFFFGTTGDDPNAPGNRWRLGGYYRGINPEDRNPPVFISPLTYSILTGTTSTEEGFNVPPEFIERLYDLDPVTGFWVRKTGSEDLPIDAGYGGYGGYGYGYPGYGYPGYGGYSYPSYGGGGGGSFAPRAPSAGLVNWRI